MKVLRCQNNWNIVLVSASLIFYLFINGLAASFSASIELVEEWGCMETEFRLTCNHIDSQIAVLDASFTPHCETNNCVFSDEDSLMKFISNNVDHKFVEEEEAGRRFLEILRKAHEYDETEKVSELKSEAYNRTEESFLSSVELTSDEDLYYSDDDIISQRKMKRKMMRNSLEKMISLYLNKIRDENEYEMDSIRNRRDTINKTRESNEIGSNSKEASKRNRKNIKSECKQIRRRIANLDRYEIELTQEKSPKNEFNIRKLLNYRCSGRNHCSYNFEVDHPYSIFWQRHGGTVHIKYICMDDFRITKYCGEKLQIGNEVDVAEDYLGVQEMSDYNDVVGEPRVEARVQVELNYHQFTNLKILKTEPGMNENRTKPVEIKKAKYLEKPRRIYSQDFNLLKVLPKNPEKDSEIAKKTKEEYYFKKLITELPPEFNESSTTSGSALEELESNHIEDFEVKKTMKNIPIIPSSPKSFAEKAALPTENYEIVIVEGEEYIQLPNSETIIKYPPTFKTHKKDHIINDTITEKNHLLVAPVNHTQVKNVLEEYRKFDGHKNGYQIVEVRKDDDESHKYRNLRIKPKKQLLQGFIMTPGYPKFYIGTGYCKWSINITEGKKIRLTILDLNIRHDEFCKDYLEVIDVGEHRRKQIFKSCSESTKPIHLISDTHNLEISFKIKSSIAFPKRGILLHYSGIKKSSPQLPII